MPIRMSSLVFAAALLAALGLAWSDMTPPPRFDPEEYRLSPVEKTEPLFQSGFVTEGGSGRKVHSGTLAELPDGRLMAAWFAGSREGAKDVAIHAAYWQGAWSRPFVLLSRQQAEEELGRPLRKLGNPVLFLDASERLWLFFVTVSLGGWSTSSISYKYSDDGGLHWRAARRLVTSPLANLSTLVRGRPLGYADGGIALPAYHELAGKFGELLRLDANGRLLDKSRMGDGRSGIQPSLVAFDGSRALAYLRSVGDTPRIMASSSTNAGLSWSPPRPSPLPNPDASVAALRTADGRYLMAYNPAELGRGSLALALSRDGERWRKLMDLQRGSLEDEYSYPFLLRTRNGEYHLIYTWQRTRMAHVRFNQAWLP